MCRSRASRGAAGFPSIYAAEPNAEPRGTPARALRRLAKLARRASCRKRGRDGTTYSRFHPSNYLSHHLAGIVTAAVFSDAAHIVEEIALLKTRTSGATRAATAASPAE